MSTRLRWLALPILSLWLFACGTPAEECQNATDDDGDGFFDCEDTDCQNVSFCLASEDCNTVGDEDGNGAADCNDAACANLAQCQAVCGDGNISAGEQCDSDNLNNTTCVDLGFSGGDLACSANCFFDTLGCGPVTGACGDGIVQVALGEQCDDGINNGSPNSNCDNNCQLVGQATCGDGVVDAGEECDGNNLEGPSCTTQGLSGGTLGCDANCTFDLSLCTGCGNNVQEVGEQCDGADLNGQTCQTFGFSGGVLGCKGDGTCSVDTSGCNSGGSTEVCTDGLDNDGDNLIDCSPNGPDADCDCNNACTAPTAITDPATVQGDTTGHNQSRTGTCVGANSPDVAFQVTASVTGDLELILDSSSDLGMYVRTTCNQNTEIGGNACADQNGPGQLENLSVPVTAGQTVFIIVDGFQGDSGPFELSVASVVSQCGNGQLNGNEECDGNNLGGESCTSQGFSGGNLSCAANCTLNTTQCTGSTIEICTDGLDNDADNQIDCNDQASCQQACGEACFAPPTIGLGTTTGTTTGHATNRQGTCDNSQQNVGPDVAFTFIAPQAGTLTATLTAGFDTILHARGTCGSQATELDCADNNGANQSETISFNVTAGQSVSLFVDGFNGASGNFSLNVTLQ